MNEINICCWNVRGIGGPTRAQRIKRWITLNHHDEAILCLQELKTTTEKTRFLLGTIDPGGTIVMDTHKEGRVGAANDYPKEMASY